MVLHTFLALAATGDVTAADLMKGVLHGSSGE